MFTAIMMMRMTRLAQLPGLREKPTGLREREVNEKQRHRRPNGEKGEQSESRCVLRLRRLLLATALQPVGAVCPVYCADDDDDDDDVPARAVGQLLRLAVHILIPDGAGRIH